MRRASPCLLSLALLFATSACGGGSDTTPVPPTSDDPIEVAPDAATIVPPAAGPDAGAPLPGPDASAPALIHSVKVMTWNTENFFDDVDDPNKQDTVYTADQVQAKIDALAKVINAQDPDVLSLQEVENDAVLGRLAAAVGLPNYKLVPSYDYRGINVAVATRLPITNVVSHLGEYLYAPDGTGPNRLARDCLEVHLTAPDGGELVLLVNHQTSQLDGSTGDEKRQAQAKRARAIADGLKAQDPSRAVIIAGDMNDQPATPSTQLYLAGDSFLDIAGDVPEAERYSYVYSGAQMRYDYILPDADTASRRTAVTIVHGADVSAASDHSPIVATFGWR